MLNFLRKYQKAFFAVIAVMVSASFFFFGTYSVMTPSDELPDREIGRTIAGKAMMQSQVDLLAYFLSTGIFEQDPLGRLPVNVLNDGVVQRDFLMTGLGVQLAEHYFDVLKGELQERIEKVRRYRPYVHPQGEFLAAEAVWRQFVPQLSAHRELLSLTLEAEPKTLGILASLYLDQTMLPPDTLKKILLHQQGQYNWLQPDPRLEKGDFSLFGFHTLEDWFGHKFMGLIAQTIINGAALAQEKGYEVSLQEVRESLFKNVREGIERLTGEKPTASQIAAVFQAQMTGFHRDEKVVLGLWQKILLFRRLFHDIGSGVLLDGGVYQQFSRFASETAQVDVYELPAGLQLKEFRDVLKLQVYLEAIAPSTQRKGYVSLGFPIIGISADVLEKRAPELVETRFTIEFQQVDKQKIANRISLKEAYDWELREDNWATVCQEVSDLKKISVSSREGRDSALEALDRDTRKSIDRLAKRSIVDGHPEWFEEAFARAETQTVEFGFRLKGGTLPFVGNIDREVLLEQLHAAPLKQELGSHVAPLLYTADGEHFYKIILVKNPSEPTIVSFVDASRDGTLDVLLDRRLGDAYPDIRKKYPAKFRTEGGWKPLKEVQDLVGFYVFSDLLEAVARDAERFGVTWPEEKDSVLAQDLYVKYRLYGYMREALAAIRATGSDEGWTCEAGQPREELKDQWKLSKHSRSLQRGEAQRFGLDIAFKLEQGDWSSLFSPEQGHHQFVHLREVVMDGQEEADHLLSQGRELLSIDARRCVMEELIERMLKQRAVILDEKS